MKKRMILITACLLGCLAGTLNVWADSFPYKMTIESQDIMEDYLYLTLADASIMSETCAELEASVNAWAAERDAEMDTRIAQLKEDAVKEAEELGDLFYGYNIYQQMKVARADDRVLSLLEEGYEYLGDAAASAYLDGINFDVQSGQILALADVVNDEAAFKGEAITYILEYVNSHYDAAFLDVSEDKLNTLWNDGMEWYMNAAGMVVVFGTNMIGGSELGTVEVPLTFEQYSSYIKEEYLLSDNAGLYQMKENIPVKIAADDEELLVEIQSEMLEYEKEYALTVNDQTADMGQFFYLGNMYLLNNTDGNQYVLFDSDTTVGDYMTHLYKIGNDGIEKTDEVYGSIDSGNSTPDSIEMSLRIYALGEYPASKSFKVDENGEFAADDGLYVVQGELESRFNLVTKAEIPAKIDGKDSTIPAGSNLKMIATDNETKVIVYVMEMDKEAELEFVKGSDIEYWNNKVGGMLEKECIKVLPYVE